MLCSTESVKRQGTENLCHKKNMSRDVKFNFQRGKYSNAEMNYETKISENGIYSIRNIVLTQDDTEFRCQYYQLERDRGSISSRRPRLVRGLYLGKQPLEYQKTSTQFRFSFQKPHGEIHTENYGEKPLKKKLIFPMSMTTGLCNLQARPVKWEQRNRFSVADRSMEVNYVDDTSCRRRRCQIDSTRGKRENELQFDTSQTKEQRNYAGRFPEEFYEAEYGTFKLNDYDIWSRTTRE